MIQNDRLSHFEVPQSRILPNLTQLSLQKLCHATLQLPWMKIRLEVLWRWCYGVDGNGELTHCNSPDDFNLLSLESSLTIRFIAFDCVLFDIKLSHKGSYRLILMLD